MSQSSLRPFTLSLDGVSLHQADQPVLVDVTLTVTEQSRIAVVGPNGVGKSTLLRVMAGLVQPDQGSLRTAPPDVGVGLLAQEPLAAWPAGLTGSSGSAEIATVRQLVAEHIGVAQADRELEQAAAGLAAGEPDAIDGESSDRYQRALDRFLNTGAADFDARLEEVADRIGLARSLLEAEPSTLSGGEAERVGLAIVMVSQFDLTLLDEPTNNLDQHGLDLLEQWVTDHQGGLVVVSHDRAFLERTVTAVLEIDGHHHTAALFNGGWQSYREERARIQAQARERYEGYEAERDRLKARAQQQREWAAQGASRVRKRPDDNDKNIKSFRLNQTEQLAGKARATEQAMERLEAVDKPWEPWRLQFTISRSPRSATVVAAADRALWRRGSFTLGPLDLEIRWADRVALVGPNGSGKSTLVSGLLGRLPPHSGRVWLGPGVVVGELSQSREGLSDGEPADRTVLQELQDGSGLTMTEARSLLAKFGLDGEALSRPRATLSPGERTRANLAAFQARGVNLVVLDEPTNHLDLEAIEQLEQALADYDGTLIVVSHDRRFLENLSTTVTIDLASPPPHDRTLAP